MKTWNISVTSLERMHHYPVVDKKMIENLKKASDTMLKAGYAGIECGGAVQAKAGMRNEE